MEFLAELGVFSGKALVLVLAIGILLILLFALIAKARQSRPLMVVEHLNEKFEDMARALSSSILDPKAMKKEEKAKKKRDKNEQPKDKKRVYVLDFDGDIRASHVENLREEVTAILTVGRKNVDEVVLRLESPGGMAHVYGLAAAQLLRFREAGLKLTICVDKIAASGGYLMACTGDHIISAPFAIIGSIGVVAQVPNFHRFLKKHDIDFEEVTAGEFKRTVSLFGEITEKGRRKFLDQLEDTHGLFKGFVKSCRPQLNLDEVATGEYWFGERAKDLKLVDEIVSSDAYLFRQREDAKIYKVSVQVRKKWSEKLAENMGSAMAKAFEQSFFQTLQSRFPLS